MVRTSAGCRTCRSVGKLAAMKSRWTISLLLAAVVAVWGLVAWKILTPGREGLRVAVPERSVGKHPAAVADTLQLHILTLGGRQYELQLSVSAAKVERSCRRIINV